MKTTLGLKNFRIFDNKGTRMPINPLTVLTGCNSSGKSSIVKALILLNEFLKGVREATPGAEPRLEFDRKPLSLLGNFESIVNKNDIEDKTITLSYTVDSLYLGADTTIELKFDTQENDIRKDGFLKEVFIKDSDGSLLYHGVGYEGIKTFFREGNKDQIPSLDSLLPKKIPVSSMVLPMKKRYFVYHLIAHEIDIFDQVRSNTDYTGKSSKKDLEKASKTVYRLFRELTEQTDKDLVYHAVDCYSKKRRSTYQDLFDTDLKCIKKAMKADIITYLPILDVLDSISKDSFETQFKDICADEKLESDYLPAAYVKTLINKVISEFTQGDYDVFSDYYRSVEYEFLKKGTMMVRSNGSTENNLAIPDWELYRFLFTSSDSEELFSDNREEAPIQPTTESKTIEDNPVTLDQLFYLLTSIKNRPKDNAYIIQLFDRTTGITSRDHRILRDYMTYRRTALKDLFTIDACNNLRYVGSNRIEIKRLYTLENQDNFSHTVSEYFEASRLKQKENEHSPGDFINKWIREFRIGQRLSIESLSNGIGYTLKIFQTEDDLEGRILADFGFGISQLISILLEIETAILKVDRHLDTKVVDYQENVFLLNKLHYLNVISSSPITIAIEEPEIHLHPKFQSLLADMFVDAYLNYGIHFIVETHSEYLIRKLQNHVGKGIIKPDALSFLYVEDGDGKDRKVREIGIAEDGRLTSGFGPGFFDEADSLVMNLLMIKGGLV